MKDWKKLLRDNFWLLLLASIILAFFYPAFLQRKIPIPADTIVGMYHPWRDKVWDNYTAGVPYKNFLITDPVRQQYVWRKLAIDELKEGRLPVWNPYSFAGTPLLANFQSAPFYPLNILFFILPFNFAWTILVLLQPLLAGIFLYFYLRYMKVSKFGSFLGGFTFAFSGFSIAWLEWNTVIQTVMWLPLILLAKEHLLRKITFRWVVILFFAEVSSFLAGHLQILFYTLIISNIYLLARIIQLSVEAKHKENIFIIGFKKYLPFLFIGLAVLLTTATQWIPTLQFILQSARDFDQGSWMKEGWFIPWQHLIQFVAPDFFGNPATGNYWGVWNYAEFIGYIGIAPFILALYALFFRRDKKTLFFGSFAILSLIFALPTPLAKLPYQLNLPFISTSQPTRLLFVTDFSLAVLTAFGLDYFLKQKSSMVQMIKLLAGTGIIYGILWFFILSSSHFGISVLGENILIAKRNLVLPTVIIFLITGLMIGYSALRKKEHLTTLLYSIVVFITVVELFRFGWKFTPFTKEKWLFPGTKILDIISQDKDQYRIMAIDRRIMPPNFAASYGFNDVAGYDPLYLKSYGQLAAAWDRGKPDLNPAAFNRIITPANYESFMADLLGVKYIVSLTPLKSEKLEYGSQEGGTYLYINKEVFPRAFLVADAVKVKDDQETIDKMFNLGKKLRNIAVVEEDIELDNIPLQSGETAKITYYSPNYIILATDTAADRFLILSDIYYPSWKAFVDGKQAKIYKVDFALRGVLVPAGEHKIEFKTSLL